MRYKVMLACHGCEIIELPKGHGRLIDADELYGDFIDGTEGYDCQTWNRSEIGDVIEYAPTIIEADEVESEEADAVSD